MAPTTSENLRVKAGAQQEPPVRVPPLSDLPLDTCDWCEQSLFRCFREAEPDNLANWQSPDYRRRAKGSGERPKHFRCRHCKNVVHSPEEGRHRTRTLPG